MKKKKCVVCGKSLVKEKLFDALNRIDELACEATEEVKTLKQLAKDYNTIYNFIENSK